jgi:hypothetical protein
MDFNSLPQIMLSLGLPDRSYFEEKFKKSHTYGKLEVFIM